MKNFGPVLAVGVAVALTACAGNAPPEYSAALQRLAAARDAFNSALPKLRADVAACQMDALRGSLEGELDVAVADVDLAAKMAPISPEMAELQAPQLNSAAEKVRSVRAGIEQCRREMVDMHRRLAEIDERCKTPTRIGMTESQVEASCWGIPDHVNRTEIAGHVSEQWVYPALGYLYFENGRLTAIQQQTP